MLYAPIPSKEAEGKQVFGQCLTHTVERNTRENSL